LKQNVYKKSPPSFLELQQNIQECVLCIEF
jgi:hypothetical protein